METDHWVKIIIRCILCVTGIIGNNWLFFGCLPKSISQLKTNSILFLNLAVSNMITNYFVDPLNILYIEQCIPVGKLFCGILLFLPELSETSGILSTMFITTYWHQKLVGSLKHGGAPVQMDNLRFIAVLLTASWTFALSLNLPHFFFVIDSENTTTPECKEQLPSLIDEYAYEVMYVTLANVIPLSGILYASIQIARTLLQNEKRMKKMSAAVRNDGKDSAEPGGDNANNISTVTKSNSQGKSGSLLRAAKSVLAVAIFFLICWVIHLIVRILGSVSSSSVAEDIESFIGATYTCVIPYIYLYGVQKLTCCKR